MFARGEKDTPQVDEAFTVEPESFGRGSADGRQP
jgi:hypothetical protein